MPLIVQFGATYHFGLPEASYVYQAAKTFPCRCVKWIPHPDSAGFHQRPLNAPGDCTAVGAEAGPMNVLPSEAGGNGVMMFAEIAPVARSIDATVLLKGCVA